MYTLSPKAIAVQSELALRELKYALTQYTDTVGKLAEYLTDEDRLAYRRHALAEAERLLARRRV